MAGENDLVWPEHDYWMYDDAGELKRLFLWEEYSGPDAEWITSPEYEPSWPRKFFWTPEQAAALSFGRSPYADVFQDGYPDEMNGSDQFPTYYCELRDHIREAQNAKHLLNPMPAKMYVEWAVIHGLPMPPFLAEEVSRFFDILIQKAAAMSSVDQQTAPSDDTLQSHNDANGRAGVEENNSESDSHPLTPDQPKSRSQDDTSQSQTGADGKEIIEDDDLELDNHPLGPRKERTYRGIIYSMFTKHHRLLDAPVGDVATNVEKVLDDIRSKHTYAKFEGKILTIKRLATSLKNEFGGKRGADNL